jgi:prepilin-type N-terminal cleavage/methylation domain-containing protein
VLAKRLREASGYSLVEVMVSIVLLAIAILPMAGMFDMGLNSVTKASNYDKARTLANLKLEEAKSLPFDSTDAAVRDLQDNFPELAGTTTNYGALTGKYVSPNWKSVTGPAAADFTGLQYKVEKQYMAQPVCNATSCAPANFGTSSTPTKLIRVTIIVGWGSLSGGTYNNTYKTIGLVTQ